MSAENSSATAEIKFSKSCDLSDIFPIVVGLEQPQTFFNYEIEKVVGADGAELEYEFLKKSIFDNFVIEYE